MIRRLRCVNTQNYGDASWRSIRRHEGSKRIALHRLKGRAPPGFVGRTNCRREGAERGLCGYPVGNSASATIFLIQSIPGELRDAALLRRNSGNTSVPISHFLNCLYQKFVMALGGRVGASCPRVGPVVFLAQQRAPNGRVARMAPE